MNMLWHYTSLVRAEEILNCGFLKVSETERKWGWKPALWFSKNQIWEPTSAKGIKDEFGHAKSLNKEEQHMLIGIARFGIDFHKGLITWAKYKHMGKLPIWEHEAMEEVGKQIGANPSDWYASFSNVS